MNPFPSSRRNFLRTASCGFGSLALHSLLQQTAAAKSGAPSGDSPLAVPTHFRPRAKRIIFLFMKGGPSQMDLFDYKPQLDTRSGQELPYKLPELEATVGMENTRLLGPVSNFARHGQSGLHLSNLLPHTARHADDLCVLRAVQCDSPNHPVAIRQMHTGNLFDIVPSMGSWFSYGLGTENQQLPSYITILPGEGERNYSSAFLPAIHQGTAIQSVSSSKAKAPIRNLTDSTLSAAAQRRRIDLIQQMNRRQLSATRIRSADGRRHRILRTRLPHADRDAQLVDLRSETEATKKALRHRRKDDRSVRPPMPARPSLCRSRRAFRAGHPRRLGSPRKNRRNPSRPMRQGRPPRAGLLTDLKARGLLHTLVLWGGEFGRTPHTQQNNGPGQAPGREHNPHGFSMWLAGGGVKGGITHGTTDDYAYHAVDGQVHINDLHATLLHLLGLDHERLTYEHHGRPFRLTDVAGNVVKQILA